MLTRYLSDMMVKPHQSPLFDNPENYDLKYEDVAFEASDGVTIRGWLIEGGNDKIIIQSHFGVQCNEGYCPEGSILSRGNRILAFCVTKQLVAWAIPY